MLFPVSIPLLVAHRDFSHRKRNYLHAIHLFHIKIPHAHSYVIHICILLCIEFPMQVVCTFIKSFWVDALQPAIICVFVFITYILMPYIDLYSWHCLFLIFALLFFGKSQQKLKISTNKKNNKHTGYSTLRAQTQKTNSSVLYIRNFSHPKNLDIM